jgi:arsenate reductase-like glutaredoxin family protein
MTVTIYHNPDCGASRNTLALVRNAKADGERVIDEQRKRVQHG